jgi:uncharacterized protein (TIGR01777 family)
MLIGITGATGFLGTALAKAATARGHGIVAFSRRKDVSLPWAKEVRTIQMEGGGGAIDPTGLDALVHLSGENVMGYWTPGKKRRIRESRVDLTRRVVESLKQCESRPKTFICASAVGFYGDRGDEWLTETVPRGEGFLADVCVEWERAAREALALGMRVVMLRTGLVLGGEGGAWPQLRRVFNARFGSRFGDGRQWVPWIHLDDEVGIILDALESPAYNGPVNLTAPNPVTNAELTNEIADVLKKSKFIPVPALALKLVMGEASSMVLASLRAKPEVALANGYAFKYPELRDALASLG